MTKSFKPDQMPAVEPILQPALLSTVAVQFCADDMVMVDFADHALANRAVQVLWKRLIEDKPAWLIEPIAGLTTLAGLVRAPSGDAERQSILDDVLQHAKESLGQEALVGRVIECPICYDAACAPDLDRVAERTGLSTAEIRAIHQAGIYRAELIGFMPGFAYLGGLDSRLALPRLISPRPAVPEGALGIAGNSCAVYPRSTPGGWNLIGRCPLKLFDLSRSTPSLIQLGDQVRFSEITKAQFDRLWTKRSAS